MTYRFGPFVADRAAHQVVRDGRVLGLTPKQLDLLFYLRERTLLGRSWPPVMRCSLAMRRRASTFWNAGWAGRAELRGLDPAYRAGPGRSP